MNKRIVSLMLSLILSMSYFAAAQATTPEQDTNFRPKSKIIATLYHALRLRPDGTVAVIGDDYEGECDVSKWKDIVSIAGSDNHTAGLQADGTVVATGENGDGECDVKNWTGIVDIAAGDMHTVGLKSDGTVVATGANWEGECDVQDWTDIVAVYASYYCTAGIKSDGTVVTTDKTLVTSGWSDIVDLAIGESHIVGLKSDGTVVAYSSSTNQSECDVSDWKDIVALSAYSGLTIGLKSDGTVNACGDSILLFDYNPFLKLNNVKAISMPDPCIADPFTYILVWTSNELDVIGDRPWNKLGELKELDADTEENKSDSEHDNPSSWATADVTAVINAGLVPQSLQSQYTEPATRFEFCELAAKLYETVTGADIDITGRRTFNDIKDDNVEKMAALGVINGTGRNMFSPGSELTREQAATMLARLANAIKKPLAKQTATFADNGSISSWAFDSVGQIQAAGIMGGVGKNTFAPKNQYTREQSIVTLLRLYNIVI